MKKTRNWAFIALLLLQTMPIVAQEVTEGPDKNVNTGWYVGVQGGTAFAVSQFTSFGADMTRMGWTAGLHAGYRFNRVISLEAQMAWGRAGLSKRDCCNDYWLGTDGQYYEVPVAGMNGWNYNDLRSSTGIQSYGLQLNVNLLGFFHATRDSRWTLDIAPRINATGSKNTFYTLAGDSEVMKNECEWHMGAGGNLQAGYRIGNNLNVCVYTGMTWLTGNPIDGMPKHLHKANYIWESGLRLNWFFYNSRKEAGK